MMMAIHIWSDENLLSRIRHELSSKTTLSDSNGAPAIILEADSLDKLPLLNSVYAETLRCYVQAFITRGSAQSDLPIGSWWLPQAQIAMVSSHVCHMDENVWNTQDGKHPVNTFWSDRFLVKRNDETSGPLKLKMRAHMGLDAKTRREESSLQNGSKDVSCDMRGLKGSWIPYGGKILITQSTCATMIDAFSRWFWCLPWQIDDQKVDVVVLRLHDHALRCRNPNKGLGRRQFQIWLWNAEAYARHCIPPAKKTILDRTYGYGNCRRSEVMIQ